MPYAAALAAAAALVPMLALGAAAARAADAPVEVVVSGPHDRALAHWMRAVREGALPREGVTIVHVDAHPDLSTPQGPMARGWRDDVADVMRRVHIASFQLAAVRLGVVDEIVWLRPRWAETFPDGERSFLMGELPNGAIAVDDPSDHYVLDEGWAPTASLSDTQPVRLRVLPLDEAAAGGLLAASPVVLDVDLDVFATRNPSAERLRRAGFTDAELDELRRIFAPSELGLAADPATRVAEVNALLGAVGALGAGDWLALPGALAVFWQRGIGPRDLWSLSGLFARAAGDPTAVEALLRDGREVVGLPERRADADEIERTARQIAALVERGALRPALVTIARSVEDGFTPPEAWPSIEWTLLSELGRVLPAGSRIRFDAGETPAPRGGASELPQGHPALP
ncbi:MAG: hypothetical protein DCC71_01790 [Proteobacteria bacterium]|nr:MAG: hypothetical protein DCC71_01790 [Pseudomonadota bacterium]